MTVGRVKRGVLGLVVGVVWSVGGVEVAAELSEAIRAHQYRLEARTALEAKDEKKAIRALEKFERVTSERRWEFLYLYGTLLGTYGATAEKTRKGKELLMEAVREIGEEREPYFSAALKQLSVAEERLEALERAEEAKRVAAEERRAGRRFRDCEACPEMVVVPAGTYQMGSPASEAKREDTEGPVHRVTIAEPFAVGVYEVTRGQYARFVAATGHGAGNSCRVWNEEAKKWEDRSGFHWRNPGYEQSAEHPVVCVSWEDAQAYVRWLSEETGEAYRLLSEAEWEYVARAGTMTPFHFGTTISTEQANYYGNYTYGSGRKGEYRQKTVAVGRFPANAYGLHDMHGNVWEWVADCWHKSYAGAPADGGAWASGECSRRVLRGGSWSVEPGDPSLCESRQAHRRVPEPLQRFPSRSDAHAVNRTLLTSCGGSGGFAPWSNFLGGSE